MLRTYELGTAPTFINDVVVTRKAAYEHGKRLYAVNARFGNQDPANADYQVVQLRKPKR